MNIAKYILQGFQIPKTMDSADHCGHYSLLHAVWFIRNTVKFGLVLCLKFSENYTRSVAYLTFCFLILC